ncbi:MAG: Mur ligase [Gammaproteobacteria bacterium]|nr:Mur ligase [Gammaproteobacteria bacterium]
MKLVLDDSRRLTGKNLLWDKPGAIIDAFVEGVDKQKVADVWQHYAKRLLSELGWDNESTCYRIFEDGISIAISAPIDALYVACEINESAWQCTCCELQELDTESSLLASITRIKLQLIDEVNPHLLQLIELAKKKNVPYLVDDDEFSLGYGASTQCWNILSLPKLDMIDWSQYKSVPIALITGTNGKSTSVRIMSRIIKESGKCCGVTSTDFIRVGDNILDYGDYSGPGGARMLLRHADTQTAILEVARGGILRRGLPIDRVDAALITNIAEDHLGQYGINTVEALAQTKAVVAKALNDGTLVLNADDAYLVALAPSLSVNIIWFSLDEYNPMLCQQRENGGEVCFVREQYLVYANYTGADINESMIIKINDIPMTLNGAARHNISNALGAIGLAKCLNINNQAITLALRHFSSDIDDNPGRGNQFDIGGAKVIMDFAHNVHSMDAMALTTVNMPANRKFLLLSQAGDRSDVEIINITRSALKMKPDMLVIAELADYLRGRILGEVPNLIAKTAIEYGMSAENIEFVESPFHGSKKIIERLTSSDLALLMVLSERDEVVELLQTFVNQ